MQLDGSYYYWLTFVENDPTGNLINKPGFAFEDSFKSDLANYKWESDSVCINRFMSYRNL